MAMTATEKAAAKRRRERRAAQGLCSRCNRSDAVPRPGFKTCEKCAEYGRKTVDQHRERNREYYWRNHEKVRILNNANSNKHRLKARNGRPSKIEVARIREAALIRYAGRTGFIPSNTEVAKMFSISTIGAYVIRKRAFNLGDISSLRGYATTQTGWRIPYPVPAEFLKAD